MTGQQRELTARVVVLATWQDAGSGWLVGATGSGPTWVTG